jgi:nucleoside-triphosphatase THEP1
LELLSQKYKQALNNQKPVLAVVCSNVKDPVITVARNIVEAEVFTVTVFHREKLPKELTTRFRISIET